MNKIKNTIKYCSALATVLAIAPISALAQAGTGIDLQNFGDNQDSYGAVTEVSANRILLLVINGILIASGIAAFLYLLIGGIQWILAGGDKEGTEKSRKKITNALIGLAIVFSAYAIAFLVNAIFNVNILNFDIPNIRDYAI